MEFSKPWKKTFLASFNPTNFEVAKSFSWCEPQTNNREWRSLQRIPTKENLEDKNEFNHPTGFYVLLPRAIKFTSSFLPFRASRWYVVQSIGSQKLHFKLERQSSFLFQCYSALKHFVSVSTSFNSLCTKLLHFSHLSSKYFFQSSKRAV